MRDIQVALEAGNSVVCPFSISNLAWILKEYNKNKLNLKSVSTCMGFILYDDTWL